MADFPLIATNFPSGRLSTLDACAPAGEVATLHTFAGGSAVYPTANMAFFYPVICEDTITVVQMGLPNGTAVSGNVDVGIYTPAGTRLVSMGSTAQAGISTTQAFNIADTTLTPGLYYLAMACSNTTSTFIRQAPPAMILRTCGVASMAAAMPLPATATFAGMASAYHVGIVASTQSVF